MPLKSSYVTTAKIPVIPVPSRSHVMQFLKGFCTVVENWGDTDKYRNPCSIDGKTILIDVKNYIHINLNNVENNKKFVVLSGI